MVIVVGGGVFGATAAWELARRGYAVRLFEAGDPPRPEAASTDISKLVRADYGVDGFHREMMERALPRWSEWNAAFTQPRFHRTGLLLLAARWAKGCFEFDSFAALSGHGHPVTRKPAPSAWRGFPYAYVSEAAGWVESGAVVSEVLALAERDGVEVRSRSVVSRVVVSEGRAVGVEVDGVEVPAEAVIVAGGAWTTRLLPELADRMHAIGQIALHFAPEQADRFASPRFLPWCADIANSGFYGFPATAEGVVKVARHGAGVPVDPDVGQALGPEVDAPFRSFFARHLPALADAPVVLRRSCPYNDTFDGRFFIDRHPTIAGLVVSSGGSGHAFKFAPLLGALAADALEGRTLPELAWRPRTKATREAARART